MTDNAKNYHEKMFPGYVSDFLRTDPEFIEAFDNFAFDEVVNQDDLDDKTRFISILAVLLGYQGIDEFKGMNPKDVVQYIEGEPYISTVPVDTGSTNVEKEQDGEKVIGLNTENSELHEGLARFDIIRRLGDGSVRRTARRLAALAVLLAAGMKPHPNTELHFLTKCHLEC